MASVSTLTVSVCVESRLADMLVVSYRDGTSLYRGVLMNTTRQNIPCGVYPSKTADEEADKLSLVSQRMTYFWSKPEGAESKPNLRRTIIPPAKFREARSSRLNVRLRPRNVLCSKCRAVCNERSEYIGDRKMKSRPRSPAASLKPCSVDLSGDKVKLDAAMKLTRLEDLNQNGNRYFEDAGLAADLPAPVLKISLGPNGSGTVVNLHATRKSKREKKSKRHWDEDLLYPDEKNPKKRKKKRGKSSRDSDSVQHIGIDLDPAENEESSSDEPRSSELRFLLREEVGPCQELVFVPQVNVAS
ncbi:unnamed protein product [Notodromas monacha]|uniref:Uncharacterized protein n=1 Tax=Notodromas monacha TaxID=399045 RepID=A0A7R9BP98_9CRUS|nr:unnamed protein product [Notodromas monacha]CAG0917807.1 unnamed protein product [Notodromas monacha]